MEHRPQRHVRPAPEFKVVGPGASLLELGDGKVTDKAAPPQKTWKIFVAAAGVKTGP